MRNQQRTFGDRTLSSLLGLAVLAVWVVPLEAQISRRAPGTRMPAVEGPGLLIGSRLDDATPPSNITTAATATSITLSWPAVAGASSYSICRGTPPGCSNLTSAPITATQITDSGLTPGTPYTYSVSAARPDGHYGSATVPAATKPPVNPSNFKAAVQSGGQVVLTWDAVPDAKFYYLQGDQLKGQSLTTTTHTVSGLSGGTFAYQLVAEYGNQPLAGVGDYRNPARITATVPRWRGQYRVTLNGFSVNRETWDHALEVDGKRDEVYLAVTVDDMDPIHGQRLPTVVRSTDAQYGDRNGYPTRVVAGSASAEGGLRTGDNFPSTPWIRTGSPGPTELPLLLWQGELRSGEDLVVFGPAVWEWDGGKDMWDAWISFNQHMSELLWEDLKRRGLSVNPVDLGMAAIDAVGALATAGVAKLSLLAQPVMGQAQDRPIGTRRAGKDAQGRLTFTFAPQLISLDLEAAEKALEGSPQGGLPPGILAVRYEDDADLRGDYTLYLQVDRIE